MSLGLERPALLVISDGSADPGRVLALGRAAIHGGAWGFLVREPGLEGRALVESVEGLRREADESGVSPGAHIVVSDRVDVALAALAFGVLLGERSLPVARVRAWVGDRLKLGRSVHDAPGVRAAIEGGADWLVFGHVFATPAKMGLAPAGLAGLRGAVEAAGERPVFAIGGIEAARVAAVVDQGACGVAVIGAVARAVDHERAVRELVQALAAAGGRLSGGS